MASEQKPPNATEPAADEEAVLRAREQLVERLQERYGLDRSDAEQRLRRLENEE